MESIKEIHVNGELAPELLHLFRIQTLPWRSLDDSVTITIYLDSFCTLSSFGFQFWAMCHADSVRIAYGSITASGDCSWVSLPSDAIKLSESVINRTVDVVKPGFACDRIRIEMSHGHLDGFFHRYHIGIKRMNIEATHLSRATPDPIVEEGSKVVQLTAPISIKPTPMTSGRRTMRRDPLFVFPQAAGVFAALYQRRTSPWQLLSAKSRHKEKIRERLSQPPEERYLLPRLGTPTNSSLPSRGDVLRRCQIR